MKNSAEAANIKSYEFFDLGDATLETKGFDFTGVMDQVSDRRSGALKNPGRKF